MPDDRSPSPPPILVASESQSWRFDHPFKVGRDESCEVRFEGHPRVSRVHLEITNDGGEWQVRDNASANGLLVGGEKVDRAQVVGTMDIQVGEGGPMLRLHVDLQEVIRAEPQVIDAALDVAQEAEAPATRQATDPHPDQSVADSPPAADRPPRTDEDGKPLSYEKVVERYFVAGDDEEEVGERTKFIRQAYVDIQQATEKQHKAEHSKYRNVVIGALLVSVVAIGFAGYREYTIRQLRAEAEQIFYQLRTYDIAVAEQVQSVEEQIAANPELEDSLRIDLDRSLEARRQTAARYDQFIRGLGVYDGLSSEEEAIYKVARAFGESELTIPPEFVAEVKVYVNRWKNSNRFQTAVRTAQVNGYIPITVDALRRNGMPPEFFYLALQESNYDTKIVGPWTRYGHAKGAWQFIPETGRRYGLKTGPLVATDQYDPLDERHDFDAAANAAARYLKDIYVHLAQASGLLVCASYNWGEGRVRRNMDQLKRDFSDIGNDPSHRTYWRFLTVYRNRMPEETRGYVMNIFAAAVIGQNPRMFGIDMDPPLAAAIAGGGGIRDTDPDAPNRPRTRMGGDALDRRSSP